MFKDKWGKMEKVTQDFITYMKDVKKKSANTCSSYANDLGKFHHYLQVKGIGNFSQVTTKQIQDYVDDLYDKGFKPTTLCRNIASIKAFYHYLARNHMVEDNVADPITNPKIEKSAPTILTVSEIDRLLQQPVGDSPKEIRDKAMLEILYATGIRVSELITLKVDDVNLKVSQIKCKNGNKTRSIPFGQKARRSVIKYLQSVRQEMVQDEEEATLFVNCSGTAMSRQGFWKLIKEYAGRAGIDKEITPQTLRHSFAAHLLNNGADPKSVQEMMGYAAVSSTQVYLDMGENNMRTEYSKAHPRH